MLEVVTNGVASQAVCYIAVDPSWRAPPAESYLTAIHVHLREHWRMVGDSITVRKARGRDVEVVSEFRHPWYESGGGGGGGGRRTELSLEALVVEASNNERASSSFVMPKAIQVLCRALAGEVSWNRVKGGAWS